MPPRRGCHLPVADKTFLDNPELVLIRPLPTANAIGCGENFDLRAVNEIGHNVGLIIGSQPKSDGPRRSVTPQAPLKSIDRRFCGCALAGTPSPPKQLLEFCELGFELSIASRHIGPH